MSQLETIIDARLGPGYLNHLLSMVIILWNLSITQFIYVL